MMKKFLFIIYSLFSLSTICSISWALPYCNVNAEFWDNCFGTYEWPSGEFKRDTYIGEWKNNKKHGQGTYNYLAENEFKGDQYVGEYKNGYVHGQGTYITAKGNKYVGEFREGRRNGQFVVSYSNGDKYVGEYKNDIRHSQGTYIYGPNSEWAGDKYMGEHKDGERTGLGIYFWADGRKDVGEFKKGKLNGYAIQYNANGTIDREGIFKDDVFQYAQKKSSTDSNSNSKLNKYKEFCEEIGFATGTEKFANCVLEAMKKD